MSLSTASPPGAVMNYKDQLKQSRELYLAQKRIRDSINSIPKKNKQKFYSELLDLIENAHEGDYNDD